MLSFHAEVAIMSRVFQRMKHPFYFICKYKYDMICLAYVFFYIFDF